MGSVFPMQAARYRRKDLLAAVRGKMDVGDYEAVHLDRYAMIVREVMTLAGAHTHTEPFRLLDFGSFSGVLSLALKALGYDVYCMDVEPVAAQHREFYEKHDLKLTPRLNGYTLPYEDGYFDCVVFSEVLEHLYDSPLDILTEFKRVLKPDGHLLLTTPNVMRIENKVKFLLNINIYQDIYRYVYYPRYAPHYHEYTKKDLRVLLGNYVGYSPVRVKMFDFAGGRSRLRRAVQRCLYSINILLPMFKGTLVAIAGNATSPAPRAGGSPPASVVQTR
jgi:2-polyprenyl-3-methyl-5-hydroxy-6-metoxy-1,4-benzoquinol methylase